MKQFPTHGLLRVSLILGTALIWGLLLGLAYGVGAGIMRLAPQGYVHAGLYRLWLHELTGYVALVIGYTWVATVAAVVCWGLGWWIVRGIARPFSVDPRTPWGALMVLLLGLPAWWIWWDARGLFTDIINITPAAAFWKTLMSQWDSRALPLRWVAAIFLLGPGLVSLARLRLRPADRLRWFDRIAFSRTVHLSPLGVLVATGLVLLLGPMSPLRRPAPGPDVILITIDTVRADHLSCYGYHRNTTPQLDALAREGVLFSAAYAPSNWTAPSVGSTLTGLYPSEHGATLVGATLRPAAVTIAESLRNAGYATRAAISHIFVNHEVEFDQGFEVFDESGAVPIGEISSDQVTDVALRLLQERDGRPLFLWLHYFDPHYTYLTHPGYEFDEGYQGKLDDVIDYDVVNPIRAELPPEDIQHIRDVYDSELAYTDHHVGRLLAALRAQGFFKRGLLIVHGDHGEEFMERGNLAHQNTLYNELIHVPLIVAGAIDVPANRRVPDPVTLLSVPRTILDFCGVVTPPYPGSSLLAVARGSAAAELPLLAEGTNHRDRGVHTYALLAGERKAIWIPADDDWKFYDVVRDPAERENLADSPGAAAFADLQEPLRSFAAEMASALGTPDESIDIDAERMRELKALGYMGAETGTNGSPDDVAVDAVDSSTHAIGTTGERTHRTEQAMSTNGEAPGRAP